MSHYAQLTQDQRYQSYIRMKAGLTQAEIADLLGVDKFTISRELRRNSVRRGYRPGSTHQLCIERRQQKASPRIDDSTWQLVSRLSRADWSPKQIYLWLKQEAR